MKARHPWQTAEQDIAESTAPAGHTADIRILAIAFLSAQVSFLHRALNQGRENALSLTTIFLNERRSLIGTVLRIVRDPQTAEDLAQEAYLRARKSVEGAPIEHVEAFLHQTARNLAMDHERRRKTRERFEASDVTEQDVENIPADVPTIEAALIERERLRAFNAALNALPERARQAWILSQIDGWSYARIADHLNVSRNTVYNDVKLVVAHCQQTLARLDRD